MSILPLPDAVRQQINSSIQITTLCDVVEELLRNSLDAAATTVQVEVDFAKGFCSVEDDGTGIPASDFAEGGNLARMNCTSKLNTSHAYGQRGCFLSYLSSLSLTSISSKHGHAEFASAAFLGHSTILSRQPQSDEPVLNGQGTRVIVHNLFGNLPVRFKHLALRYAVPAEEERAFDDLKRRFVGYLLASAQHLALRLSTRNGRLKYTHQCPPNTEQTRTSVFSLQTIESVLRQAGLTHSPHSGSWKLASAKAGGVAIRAAICLTPSPSKQSQFVSFDHLPIFDSGPCSLVYDTVNAVFDVSHFGTVEDRTRSTRPATGILPDYKQSNLKPRSIKGVDRWPRFYLRIDTKSNTALNDIEREYTGGYDAPSGLQAILDLSETLLIQFLQAQDLESKGNRSRNTRSATKTPAQRHQTGVRSSSISQNWRRHEHSSRYLEHSNQYDLPFTSSDDLLVSELVLDDDVRLLLGDIDLDPEGFGILGHHKHSVYFRPFPYPEQMYVDEEVIWWRDHLTGQNFRVEPNNCFVLAQAPADSHQTSGIQLHLQAGKNQAHRLLQTDSSRADLAERLKLWPSAAFRSAKEQGIRSVVLHGDANALDTNSLTHSVLEHILEAERLTHAIVLNQIDTKFILAVVQSRDSPVLVLIDQHAADERVKVEELYSELCSGEAIALTKPIKFEVSAEERKLLARHQDQLLTWTIGYTVESSPGSDQQNMITVTHLPTIIAERCRLEPKILIELLRREAWCPSFKRSCDPSNFSSSWVSRLASCPEGLVEMANSRACRTAIMFNDALTKVQCEGLLKQLAGCTLPFQCAHGRPSMTVLASVGELGLESVNDDAGDFGYAYRSWCEQTRG